MSKCRLRLPEEMEYFQWIGNTEEDVAKIRNMFPYLHVMSTTRDSAGNLVLNVYWWEFGETRSCLVFPKDYIIDHSGGNIVMFRVVPPKEFAQKYEKIPPETAG